MKDFMGLLVDISCSCRLLLLLAASLPLPTAHSLLSPDGEGLSCLSDFDTNIFCVWNSTRSAQHADITAATSCKLNALKNYSIKKPLSCNLMPLDHSVPAIRACTLVSTGPQVFLPYETWYIFLVCDSVKEMKITYKPDEHIKLKPPQRPEVNGTTVSLLPEVPRIVVLERRRIELYWKQEHQSWEDALVVKKNGQCDQERQCKVELDMETLEKGRTYQARTRIRPQEDEFIKSVWSDWSSVVTWVSPIGTIPAPGGIQWEALVTAAVGAVVVLSLAIVIRKTDREPWVYMVKKIRGSPLPNLDEFLGLDGKSQVWLKTDFTNKSHYTTQPDVISSVEVTNRYEQTFKAFSSYSNPTYPSPPNIPGFSSPTPCPQWKLEPCTTDSPYGPVGEESTGEPKENVDLLDIISRARIGSAGSMMTFCADYEKVVNVAAQRSSELWSPDSGVGRSEQEEQDSQDGCRDGGEGVDSQSDNGSQGSDSQEEEEEGEGSQFEKLLSDVALGAFLGQGSLEVCLEKVRLLEGQQCRAQSPDSGVGSGGEQVSQESLEDVDSPLCTTRFTFPPLCDTCPQSSFIQTPSLFPGQGTLSSFSFSLGDGGASMTSTSTILPCSSGYM